jgi:hypothetical protein
MRSACWGGRVKFPARFIVDHDVVEVLADEFVRRLRTVARDIDLAVRLDRLRLCLALIDAGAEDFEAVATNVAQDPLRHLAAS